MMSWTANSNYWLDRYTDRHLKKGKITMETLFNIGVLAAVFFGIVKVLGLFFDPTSAYSSSNTVGQANRSIFDDDNLNSSSSMFENDDSSTSEPMFEDDGPSRGMWDITSTYYSMMHSEDHVMGCGFDDHTSICSSFDDSSSMFDTSSSFDD